MAPGHALMNGAVIGSVAGAEGLDLHSPLPGMELGEGVARSEGREMPFDSIEALRLEASQEPAEASADRLEFLTNLGQTRRKWKPDLVLHRSTVVGFTET